MFAIIGAVIVICGVFGGYAMEHGNFSVLIQPAEFVIIYGAAAGAFLIASPKKVVSMVVKDVIKVFTNKPISKDEYQELLLLLNGIFFKIRQQGLVAVESDVDDVENSPLFTKYPSVMKNHHAISFIADTLRTVMSTTIESHELDALMDNELESHHGEMLLSSQGVAFVADALPGLGIVACVMGVVITMGFIGQPPEILGHHVGAALVGTFLGVLTCYGFVAPLGKNMEHLANENMQYLNVVKVGLLAFIGGAAPKVAVEFGRRVVPGSARPTFAEIEELMRQKK
ncbi:MAG: Motility protein A [Syntrophus sp. SKADARSKE-3]|nr:Motility protein A [Syntrophus sp. SKADARSKE-3]